MAVLKTVRGEFETRPNYRNTRELRKEAVKLAAESGLHKPAVIRITAQKFFYVPDKITLKKGVPVVLEFISRDVLHGFNCAGLGIRTDIFPGKTTTINLTPLKTGTFPFHCDNFCGSGHDNMSGTITVVE